MTDNGTPRLQIDPFFDGEGGVQQTVQTPRYAEELAGRQFTLAPDAPRQTAPNVRGTTTAACDNVQGYRDVREMTLDNGRPLAAVMRGGPTGLGGTVIPHAGLGGVPMGVRLHEPGQLEVNIDPHIEGARSRVRLADVVQHMGEAQQLAAASTPDPYSIETMRLRGAAVMHGVAQLTNAQRQQLGMQQLEPEQLPYESPQHPNGNIPSPNQAQMAGYGATPQQGGGMHQPPPQHMHQQRQSRPLQSFLQQSPTVHPETGREMRPIDLSASPSPPERGPAPPEVEVTFEIQQFGMHTAQYHDVIATDGFVVLVYNRDYPGRMYAPPAGEDSPPMAIAITGHSTVYLVHATGIQYVYGKQEFCVLLVERTGNSQ